MTKMDCKYETEADHYNYNGTVSDFIHYIYFSTGRGMEYTLEFILHFAYCHVLLYSKFN